MLGRGERTYFSYSKALKSGLARFHTPPPFARNYWKKCRRGLRALMIGKSLKQWIQPVVLLSPFGRSRVLATSLRPTRRENTYQVQGPNHVMRTKEFPIQPGEDVETNPGVFGRLRGLPCRTDPQSRSRR